MAFHSVSVEIGGRDIIFETGKIAKQAAGSIIVKQGDSSVLVTAHADTTPVNFDFLPLTIEFRERTGAYGKIPGGFFKREGRPNERETLVARVIDRPIRPLLYKQWRYETQVICTGISFDEDNDIDVLSLCGASAALMVSDVPMKEAVAGVRIAEVDGQFVINPSCRVQPQATINLVVAGTAENLCMVEGGGNESSEARMLEALDLAHAEIKKIVAAINELAAIASKPKRELEAAKELDADVVARLEATGTEPLKAALATKGKHERKDALKAARNGVIEGLVAGVQDAGEVARITEDAKAAWDKLLSKVMRKAVLETGTRIDGRATDEIRSIECEVGIAPRAHGSALFTRGETQTFTTVTLGVEMDAQRMDHAGAQDQFRRWLLTYTFPPYSVGEVRRIMGPKRREIGHGALAHRGLEAVIPTQEAFPYVIRQCTDVTESNGSSSMATVCGGTLALMDAGVPIKKPVAGIAMGLIKEGDDFAVLSDILGDEDHLGDMDFKVTGTTEGITAFQMDVKIAGIPREVMVKALAQAREGRIHILGEMAKTIAASRSDLSPFAPRITTIKIKVDKIRDIIGPGGKVIRSLQDKFDVRLTVEDDGSVSIASTDQVKTDKAVAAIRELTQEAEIGKLYLGVVKRTVDFGAFVEIFPGTEGLIHISHLANERVERTTDVVVEGDEVLVRVIDIDKTGKVRLSRKEALESAGDFS